MDFSWSQEELSAYDEVKQFAIKQLSSADTNNGSNSKFSRDLWDACAKFGLVGLCVPKQYSGQELTALATARTLEALAEGGADLGLLFSICAHLFACIMPIVHFGTINIKETFLPSLATGKWIGANAITEINAGSDVYALESYAEKKGDFYILNGFKNYVTNGPISDIILVYAKTNLKAGHLGITCFAIESNTPGIVLKPAFNKMGLNTAQGGEIHFTDCKISETKIVGVQGQGAHIFNTSMLWERTCLFAIYIGMMERQLQKTIDFTRNRKQFGKPISKQQVVAHKLADMKLRLESARLLLYRACWSLDNIANPILDVALSKLAISEAAIKSSLESLHLHGGYGYKIETGIEQMLRDSIPATIFSGTSEMQRNIIAHELGL